ncbi:sporulation/spore germination protein [Desulfosporosinus orientis DSM 765]|uniref:Sporulation/spore germination protein n=1 Tax=Desulfosporosinus orientis (strain ATCC 19365 / DSM 765 / NCIMB 8382 / VKM B-1628 / Singapore I) TaxID=768706 RepID=G7WF41_DESOD|nr:GerMN domain-containing protein [Desulfosporosinus orientis]AET67652.1 sporulation/spore germination protein [Desulfosporosinus orientis DSM 765]
MKKVFLVLSLFLVFMLLDGCSTKNDKPPVDDSKPQDTQQLTIQDYYPFKDNTTYIYEGEGNEFAAYTAAVDYIQDNRIQIRSNNGGTEMVRVLENSKGALTLIYSQGETYYRENLTQGHTNKEEILLKEPLKVGNSWTLADGRKRIITNLTAEVTTPLGAYKALEVTTEGEKDKTQDYYAPDIGLVKTVFTSNDFVVTSALSKLEDNVPLTQTVKFFYPNVNDDKLYYINKKLTFKTNDLTKTVIEKAFKELPNGEVEKVLGPNVKINSLYLNKDNAVYIDFSKELTKEMNAGSGYESMILQSITNTIGTYYGVDKVCITIESNPYSSGHYVMNKGEFFKVDLTNSYEL